MTLFSERLNYVQPKLLQLEVIDTDLKNRLWNMCEIYIFSGNEFAYADFEQFKFHIYHNFLKQPLYRAPQTTDALTRDFRKFFFDMNWFKVYDFIEFSIQYKILNDVKKFIQVINVILEQENSGYRIINKKISPISSELEMSEIKTAMDNSAKYTYITEANDHLRKSLQHLSNRPNADYANSIKESISAVESAARNITGEPTLGKALSKIEQKLPEINRQLKESFNKIYNYTNAPDNGIRHGKVDEGEIPNYETAKYLLVTSCAFINYLVGLGIKSDLIK